VQRLWLQSMTPQAIRDGFEKLRSNEQMLGLADAARSRSEADWLVGINGTRAMTAFNSRDGGFFLTTVGRVQTPTLSIVVEREEKIRKHVPRDYWEIKAEFGAQAGVYEGKWFDPASRRTRATPTSAPTGSGTRPRPRPSPRPCAAAAAPSPRRPSPAARPARAVRPDHAAARGQQPLRLLGQDHAVAGPGPVRKAQGADLPADRFAPPAGGLSQRGQADLRHAGRGRPARPAAAPGPHARKGLKEGYIKPSKRIFDNAKVSDHFAIIPTLQAPKSLTEAEAKLYDLVVKRFIGIFFPSAEYMVTTRITKVPVQGGTVHQFQTNGKVLVNRAGWPSTARKPRTRMPTWCRCSPARAW
jgi:DNA topoisomerase-3